MDIDPHAVTRALRLPAGTGVDLEPLGEAATAPVRASLKLPDGERRTVLVRAHADPEAAANHAAVMEALTAISCPHAPRVLALADGLVLEEDVDGVTALAVVVGDDALEEAVATLAELHSLQLKEGLRWEQPKQSIPPGPELPLHRLGFAAPERDAALPALAALREAMAGSPFGFVHGEAVAANVLFTGERVMLVDFGAAGYGPQLADLAAFLLTTGGDASLRRALAASYARLRGLNETEAVDLTDAAGLLWGLDYLLDLPRRLIEAFGDEAAVEAITTTAARIERGLREAAGEHPTASALRGALWPG